MGTSVKIMQTGLDMNNRDPNNLNGHLQVVSKSHFFYNFWLMTFQILTTYHSTVNLLYTDTRYNDKISFNEFWPAQGVAITCIRKYARILYFTLQKLCVLDGYLVESSKSTNLIYRNFTIFITRVYHFTVTVFIPTLDITTKLVLMIIWPARNLRSGGYIELEIMQEYCFQY